MSDSRAATRRLKVGSNGKCFYCRRAFGDPTNGWTIMTLDHRVPRARGGTRNGPNGVLSCAGCNQTKADMTGEEYRYFLKTGQLHADYIAWLTEKAIRMAKARGIFVGAPRRDNPMDHAPLEAVRDGTVPIDGDTDLDKQCQGLWRSLSALREEA